MEGRIKGEIHLLVQSGKRFNEKPVLTNNRSGHFTSKQKGKRRSKSSGKFKTFLHN